ncbi:MAG TPA: PQQ-dependent dehydrogenase, methanol/ethanol family, partial [Steroidobacteraceae bacterium]|nr:PQQ-dependent dehydrogenase, methanol/ethanol family [Steroidobacteraceae bacterium]
MRLLPLLIPLSLMPCALLAQTVPEPVPADEVFSPEQIGHALAAPTPDAGKAAASRANAPEDDGQWTMPAKNFASTRFSSLTELTPENVKNLQPLLTFSLDVNKGQEAAPIVADNTMYVVTAYPNYVYALDLTKPGAPLKWKFAPKPVPASQGVACCDVVNRGGSVDDGKYIFTTLDGQVIALDVKTGKAVWRTRLGNINTGESITMAPLVAKGHVYVGNSGGEMGVRGWLTALDESSGKLLWKAYSTGPDAEVLIGSEFKPAYASDRGTDLGVKSWPPQAWKIGGGSVWGWPNYDAEFDTIYYGTGNPGPWNAEQRPGDNKWTAGIFARDPANGSARWFYQFTPHDEHDYDGINEQILLDMPFGGQMRKVLIHFDRNGYIYVIDRKSGQVLSADPFSAVNSSRGVDLKTGRLIINPAKQTKLGEQVTDICPTASGAKDWQPSSFSPQTGLIYIPHENICMDWMDMQVSYIEGTPYVGAQVHMKPGPGGNRGAVTAWDPVRRHAVWQAKENFPVWSGTVATGGGLVFYGTMDGWFKAVNARTGELVWRYKVDSGVIGQ